MLPNQSTEGGPVNLLEKRRRPLSPRGGSPVGAQNLADEK